MLLMDLEFWYIDLLLELIFHNITFPVAFWQPASRAMKPHNHLNKSRRQHSKRLSVIQNTHKRLNFEKQWQPQGNGMESCNTVRQIMFLRDALVFIWALSTSHGY